MMVPITVGFQRQKNAPSIQQGLEEALETLIGAPTGIVAAGRTDAGVHAEGQVIAFDTLWPHSLTDLRGT
jgi:tRNA pseudouridine38-40 synthase